MLRLSSILITFVFMAVSSLFSFSGGGTGTQSDPYRITNANQLQEMKDDLDAYYVILNDIDASGTESWNGGDGFEPIGTYTIDTPTDGFTGSLNGYGYTISGLYIDRSTEDYVGLFGCVSDGGVVQNVNITNARINGKISIGILSGIIKSEEIDAETSLSNCSVSGTVSGDDIQGSLSGAIYSFGGYVSLQNCSSSSTVTTSNTASDFTGGLCGRSMVNSTSGNIYIENCSSYGYVSGENHVGGFSGEIETYTNGGSITFSNCKSECTVNGTGGIGGFAGTLRDYHASSTIYLNYCSSLGDVSVNNDYSGGFIGSLLSAYGTVTLSNCFSSGNVEGTRYVGGGFRCSNLC